jgi:hypothetical protein
MSASDRKLGTTSSTSNIIRVSPSVAAGSESIVVTPLRAMHGG